MAPAGLTGELLPAGVAPGSVFQVLELGYRIHERVLRPARVVVAAASAAERGG